MNSWLSGIYALLFLGFWRMIYEAANASQPESPPALLMMSSEVLQEDPTLLQKEWSARAVKKYAEAQERKWQRWNEAMFERSD